MVRQLWRLSAYLSDLVSSYVQYLVTPCPLRIPIVEFLAQGGRLGLLFHVSALSGHSKEMTRTYCTDEPSDCQANRTCCSINDTYNSVRVLCTRQAHVIGMVT